MPLIIEKLNVVLKGKKIVKEASLKVAENQFVGIIGPNGCGKTTLVKAVAGSVPKQAKTLRINDFDLMTNTVKEISKKMSVVGQFNEINFDLTVEEMVLLGRTPYKKMLEGETAADYTIVEKALTQMDLLNYRHRHFLSLSGGEKQRVIVARAMCQQTPFMILDEPTNHLDITHQLALLKQLKSTNTGILAVLHDIEMAARYCDYIYAMKDGEIIAAGSPEEVLTSEILTDLYDVPCHVYQNPVDQGLQFYFEES